ncbi:hypothetical protein NDU88_004481 [Pleurodeles waltl]|uniref:Uncharacterized protein n=1 Tax=Pleurodeles waltl TaxID=8319 RepID=A0AAV7W930_PLEWA|nr:hypothetical protein NDU88_004481 [Pleurodeles waltl]
MKNRSSYRSCQIKACRVLGAFDNAIEQLPKIARSRPEYDAGCRKESCLNKSLRSGRAYSKHSGPGSA